GQPGGRRHDGRADGRDTGAGADALGRSPAVRGAARAGRGLPVDRGPAGALHGRAVPGGGERPRGRAWLPIVGWPSPEVRALALVGCRVLPVALLCPLLGGRLNPVPVRLAVALSLTLVLRPVVGAGGRLDGVLLFHAAREAAFGLALGLVAAVPFEAARM